MSIPKFHFTFWKAVFAVIMVAGIYCTYVRFAHGLGASTNLSDQFPWGLWIGFDVMCGVMLAAGGFTLTALVEIFNIKRLHSIIRPTILTAFMGYLLVCAALMYDLGLPWNIWHPLIMRNPHSVMFEVAYCVMLYTTVLALEFSPIVLEHFNLQKPLRIIRRAMIVFVILGVLLSTLHQSSLGTLYLIMPNKLHPFWYSPLLPVFFFLSAIAVGLAMIIFESSMSSKYFGRELELPILRDLGRGLVVVLMIYGILRFEDLYNRGVLRQVFVPSYEQRFFLLEIFLSVLAPLALLLVPKIRNNAQGLYLASVLTLLGFVTNRLNVAITGVESAVGGRYTPKWTEVVITAMFVALGFAIFGFVAKYLPIFPEEKAHLPALRNPASVRSEVTVPAHMLETENPAGFSSSPGDEGPAGLRPRWLGKIGYSVSAKLMALLFLVLTITFLLFGYFSIRLHRKHLEDAALVSAEQQSEVLRRSASRYMLRNDRIGLYEMMVNMADQPGMVRVRIMNPEGLISYSTSAAEVGNSVDKSAEACYGCHAQSQPLTLLNRSDRFRVYQAGNSRVLGIITPIENQPACSNAACHAHPASTQILGVLDTSLSLAKVDASLAQERRTMLAYTGLAMIAVISLSGLFVWIVVHNPLRALEKGTERVATGELGYQIPVESQDEVGELARSFNAMSARLQLAQAEITAWARTLEDRVEEKTRELKQAHQRMLHVEKMATIGKMAAVVAHEINNPLSGILTYSKLVKRWIQKNASGVPRNDEMSGSLDIIASESKRCGELVKNLLSFSRVSPMNLSWCDINQVIDRCVRLVQHKMDMANIQLSLDLASDLPVVHCDPAQIEQVALAMVINAIDALPQGGNLWVSTAASADTAVELIIRDDGIGIPAEHLPHIFEPFYTTKESGGSGLGLAISQNIVERHGGHIDLQSVMGQGTRISVVLPIDSQKPVAGVDAEAGFLQTR